MSRQMTNSTGKQWASFVIPEANLERLDVLLGEFTFEVCPQCHWAIRGKDCHRGYPQRDGDVIRCRGYQVKGGHDG